MGKATAVAHPNIAFIKYWGKVDKSLNLPANPSLSMNLGELVTITTIEFVPGQHGDRVTIDQQIADGMDRERVTAHLDRIRILSGIEHGARVESQNNFPSSTGLASSASAFAALTLAAASAASISLGEIELSRLARRGSGSACRSVPAGYVVWEGDQDDSSYASQVAPPEHWDLCDVVAIVTRRPKAVSSQDGHELAPTSLLHEPRLAAVPALLSQVRMGIVNRDLRTVGPAIETDALLMHAVMMTSQPSLLYWQPETVGVLHAVRSWRREGLDVYFTMDAGPNVHCLCEGKDAREVQARLLAVPGVLETLASGPGGAAHVVAAHLF